ncbi:hypothetical protein EV44_g1755 [Erysiphe necator]|uniref:Reverse transcriptase Ty1/copia-type domain-containing protein n=1 Tax=Uncinula necator TaxID=52586 RepID=A0A0B1NXF1_UNCNE|nr:hypothetical protein EV44_g1755 [Erysiphe necator]
MGISVGSIVMLNLPLHRAPESGNHWFNTYHKHHTKNLGLSKSAYDPCLLIRNDDEYFGIIGMQIDDTFGLTNTKFAELEEEKIKEANIKYKKRGILTVDKPLKFNGGLITLMKNGNVSLTQESYCKNLKTVNIKEVVTKTSSRGVVRSNLTPKDQYVAQRAAGSYIGTMCQPEVCAALSLAAQAINPNMDDAKALNKALQWQIENPKRGLTFINIEEDFEVLVFVASSFANNKDYTSQLGTIIAIKDKTGHINIIHYNSIKAKRVVRSVLNAELQGLPLGFDMGACIKKTYEKIFKKNIPLVVYTDSKSLYDCVIRLGMTLDKRMMIDVMVIRDAYEERELKKKRVYR